MTPSSDFDIVLGHETHRHVKELPLWLEEEALGLSGTGGLPYGRRHYQAQLQQAVPKPGIDGTVHSTDAYVADSRLAIRDSFRFSTVLPGC